MADKVDNKRESREQKKLNIRLISSANEKETEEIIELFKGYLEGVEDVDKIRDRNDSNNTLLHISVISGNLGMVKVLLEKGASVTESNEEGETPLSISESNSLQPGCSYEVKEIYRLLSMESEENSAVGELVTEEAMDVTGRYTSEMEKHSEENSSCNFVDLGIDAENDNLEIVAGKLGLEIAKVHENFILREQILNYINRPIGDNERNTLLMKFAERGEEEVLELMLKFEGVQVNAINKYEERASDFAYQNKNYNCLLKLLEADSMFPEQFSMKYDKYLMMMESGSPTIRHFAEYLVEKRESGYIELREFIEQRMTLHNHIIKGDLVYVKQFTKSSKSSYFSGIDNESAIYVAAKHGHAQICVYLQSIGVKFWPGERTKLKSKNGRVKEEELQEAASAYFVEDKDSHIHKLMTLSKVYGQYTDHRKEIIARLYEKLNQCKYVKMVMKVLKGVDFDVIFDFDSYEIDRSYPYISDIKIYGLTDSKIGRIYIGAKDCVTDDSPVLGTLAHELTHLSMDVVYGNYGKPYKKDDATKMKDYQNILDKVEVICNQNPKHIDDVIERVFGYQMYAWERELIVRVPHLLGIHGEKDGMRLLEEQIPELLDFYTRSVIPDYEKYTNESFFEKPLCLIESLQKYHGFIQEMEEGISPLMKLNEKFEDSMNDYKNIKVLVTSDTKLCRWQVYNELKAIHEFHLKRCCLFFDLQQFKCNKENILKAFKCNVCKYLVLITNKLHPNFSKISCYFSDTGNIEEKVVVLIVKKSCDNLEEVWKSKTVEYAWKDLNDSYKEKILSKKISYQGVSVALEKLIYKSTYSQIINPEVLVYLMNEENIRIGEGRNLFSSGYNKDVYIERTFKRKAVDDSIFKNEKGNYHLFLTGITKVNLLKRGIEEKEVGIIERGKVPNEIENKIILSEDEFTERKTFDNICDKKKHFSFHWLHFNNEEFYWRISDGKDTLIEKYLKKEVVDEETLMRTSLERKDRFILISGDAGTGKSTVISDLINKTKNPDVWVARINFNDHADIPENPKSLANVKEGGEPQDIMDYLFTILNLQHPLEGSLVKSFLSQDCRVILFMDGFDEISPFYKEKAITLLRKIKESTRAQMWVTTRLHERVDLEIELGVSSYVLNPCSAVEQASYLERFWVNILMLSCDLPINTNKEVVQQVIEKVGLIIDELRRSLSEEEYQKLFNSFTHLSHNIRMEEDKNEEKVKEQLQLIKSLIERINFTSYSQMFLKKISSSIGDEKMLFTGIPLHLHMLAEVAYHANMKISPQSDLNQLYFEFTNIKVDIFLQEKAKIFHKTVANRNMQDQVKNRIFQCLREISMRIIMPDRYKLESIEKNDVLEDIHRIGLVTEVEKGYFQFIHLTFAEYFFSDYVFESIKEERLEKGILEDVLLKSGFGVIRNFLNSEIKSRKNEIGFRKEFYNDFDCFRVLGSFCDFGDKKSFISCRHIWDAILISLRQHSSDDDMESIICKADIVIQKLLSTKRMHCFHLFRSIISHKIFVNYFNRNFVNLMQVFRYESAKFLEDLLNVTFHSGSYREQEKLSVIESRQDERKEANEEMVRNMHQDTMEFRKRFLEVRDGNYCNILYQASVNEDEGVLPLLMRHLKCILGEDGLMGYITYVNGHCDSIFHLCAINRKFMSALIEARKLLLKEKLNKLLRHTNKGGENFIHTMATFSLGDELINNLSYLKENIDIILLEGMLINIDKNGNTVIHYALKNRSIVQFVDVFRILDSCMSKDNFYRLIMTVDYYGCNFIHTVANFRKIDELMAILNCVRDLIKIPLVEILVQRDGDGNNTLHSASANEDIKMFEGILKISKSCMSQKDLREFAMRVENSGRTVFHVRAYNGYGLKDQIKTLKEYIGEERVRELLMKRKKYGKTCLHLISYNVKSKEQILSLIDSLRLISELLNSEQFERFVLCKDKYGETLLHKIVLPSSYLNLSLNKIDCIALFLEPLKSFMSKSLYDNLFSISNNKGQVVKVYEEGGYYMMRLVYPTS